MAAGGVKAVQGALEAARPAPRVGKGKPEDQQRELPFLPAGCPVKPLGKTGQLCHYLDEQGQLISLGPRDHGKTHIQSLFGRQSLLVHTYWPRLSDKVDESTGERKVTGWKPEVAAEQLQASCAHAGLLDLQGKVRERGAWRGSQGELVVHHGDKVFRTGLAPGFAWEDPDVIDGFVYPTGPAMPRPEISAVSDGAGKQLLELLRQWHWERPKIDPYLLLGFIAAAPFGGALDWRPHVWVTGDSATGKSTLEKKLLAPLFEGLSLRTHDATEASIRQVLGKQTLPVFFDELEAEANSDRANRVIKLARLASSEGVIFRGGSDHRASEFVARSCFYFTSILMPSMLAQDRNRMAILELKPIPRDSREPMLERAAIVQLGKELRRRVIDQWERYDATLQSYRRALAQVGHGGRSSDQFGTLLAFADLLMFDGPEPDVDALEGWAETLKASELAETADNRSDAEEAIEFLTGYPLQLRGGDEPQPISRFIERGLGKGITMLEGSDAERARSTLENHGLKLVAMTDKGGAREPKPGEAPTHLAIANAHEALARLFRDKRWAQGVWSQTFGRVPGAVKRVQVRYSSDNGRKATLVPIGALVGTEAAE